MLDFKKNVKNPSKRSAFTLIELSIVLVIIGLIVVGVTGGSSLVASAQLRGLITEVNNYRVAVNTFKAARNQLPGDYASAITGGNTAAVAGDDDGRIEFVAAQGTGNGSIIEGHNAFYHLINSETIDVTLVALNITTATDTLTPADTLSIDVDQTPGTHIPDSKFDNVGYMFDYTTVNSVAKSVIIATGEIDFGGSALAVDEDVAGNVQNFAPTAIMTPSDALSIDEKLDDGVANAGSVRASADAGLTDCHTTTAYDTDDSAVQCALEFAVDIS